MSVMARPDLDAMMRGPCFFCRRAMNWFTADGACISVCRYCLGYLASVGNAYGNALARRANQLGRERGDDRLFVHFWDGQTPFDIDGPVTA